MKPRRSADPISLAVIAYCETIEVPDFDEAAVASRHHKREYMIERAHARPLRIAAAVTTIIALLLVLRNIPAVGEGIERVLQAFSVVAGGTKPMTIRVVDLERARADVPFAVVEPPRIVGAPIVTVDEMYGDASRSDASIIFEAHGMAPGRDVMIVESQAGRRLSSTLLSIRGPADAAGLAPLGSVEPPASSGRRAPAILLRGYFEGRTFTPTTWVAHGTRVVVMSPPGFLTGAQMRAIRRAMSR